MGVAYTGANKLKNAENDAKDLAAVLKDQMGFKVTLLTGKIKLSALNRSILSFNDGLRKGDVALFFFARPR